MSPRRDALLQDLGLAVSKRREALELTQQELVRRCGMHRVQLANIERGARNLTIRTASKLARGLRTTLSDLFKGI